MEDTVTYEQELEQQDPIPKPKKLKIKDFAAKIKAKYPDYKDMDDTELTNRIVTKYPEYKDQVDLTPETPKKKVGTIGLEESSLQAGNVLSQSGGVGWEEIPQIEMYTLPNGEMVETDPVSISRKYKELKEISHLDVRNLPEFVSGGVVEGSVTIPLPEMTSRW